MNYLAHLFLASNSDLARLGALLGDFTKSIDIYPAEVAREIIIHRKIDSFTDSHTLVIEAKSYFRPITRRYAGIALDIFFDHILAKDWGDYSNIPLPLFSQNVYAALHHHAAWLPERLLAITPYMIEQDWLTNYQFIAGFEQTIQRIALRMKNPQSMQACIDDIQQHYAEFEDIFRQFFPLLQHYVHGYRIQIDN